MGDKVNKRSLDDIKKDIQQKLDKLDMDKIVGGKSTGKWNPPCDGIVPQ